MRIGLDLLFKRVAAKPLPEPQVPEGSFEEFKNYLTSSYALKVPDVFSSDNSLLAVHGYGDINDLINLAENVVEALMLDKAFNFDIWLNKRTPVFLRTMFILKDGKFADEAETFRKLRDVSLRLCEGYKLRKLHPEIGVHVYHNLYTAEFVLKDLKAFYMELTHEFRNFESGNHSHLHGSGR